MGHKPNKRKRAVKASLQKAMKASGKRMRKLAQEDWANPPPSSLAIYTPMYTRHSKVAIEATRARLYEHVRKYTEYIDRDRDILLLALFDMIESIREGRPA